MKNFRLFLFLFVISTSSYASIEKHFKKCPNKEIFHTIRNVDFIYMINLDQRPEKYNLSKKMLQQFGIYPYRFSAVNGWELSIDTINELGIKYEKWMKKGIWGTFYSKEKGEFLHEIIHIPSKNYFSHCMPRGSIGIVLSHLSILQDAYDSNYEIIWVMEDDIDIIKNPHIISTMIDKLDDLVGRKEWDILFTDRDTKDRNGKQVKCFSYAERPNFIPKNKKKFQYRKNVSREFRRIGARYGAYSMIISRSGMKKILNFIKTHKIFLPFDMEYTLPDDIHLFTTLEDIVSTRIKAFSDNGKPRYLENKDIL